MVSTKIDLGFNKIARIRDLDELAAVLFPGNRNHQGVFLAIYVELKWAEGQFLPVLEPIAERYGFSRRVMETVRAKMRRLGLIDHVSRFNTKHGCQEGWVLSGRFERSLEQLRYLSARTKECQEGSQRQKDLDAMKYL